MALYMSAELLTAIMERSTMRVAKPPDGGYGWVVVAASFFLQTISGGIAFSVGVFFVEFLEAFGEGNGETAWIGSINTGLLFGAGPLASILCNKFGHRAVIILGGLCSGVGLLTSAFANNVYFLYLSYGTLAGFGFCFIYVPAVVIVGLYFDRRRNLAMGLAAAGFACGNFIFAPILRGLIQHLGWRGAMIISSGLCLNCCVLGALMSPVATWTTSFINLEAKDSGIATLFNLSLLRDLKFMIFLANNILWNIGSLILLVICTDYAFKRGIPKNHGAALVSSVGMCSLIGRVLVAFFANHPRCNKFILFIVSTAISGAAITCYPASDSLVALLIFSSIYGLFFGSSVGVLGVVTAELFGVERLTSAYGYLMFGNGAGAMMGPPIAGWVHDGTGSYEPAFFLGGAVTILSALMLVCIPVLAKKEGLKYKEALPVKYVHKDGSMTSSTTAMQNGSAPVLNGSTHGIQNGSTRSIPATQKASTASPTALLNSKLIASLSHGNIYLNGEAKTKTKGMYSSLPHV